MIIIAKFSSTCPVCSASIAIGSKVEWSKGARARHVACAGGAVSAVVAVSPGRRMGSGHGRAAAVTGYSGYCTDREDCRCYDCAS